MARELKVSDWQEQIRVALDYRRRYGLEDKWAELEAMFYNVAEFQDQDAPNIIVSTGDALLSTLTVPNPKLLVKARSAQTVQGAPIVESVDNALLREIYVCDEVEYAAAHAFLWGNGILKVGYDSEYGYDPSEELSPIFPLGATFSQFNKQGERIEYDSRIRPGMPWVKACLPHDILVPWGTRDLDSAEWIIHRVIRHIDDIRADPKYSKTRDLQPELSMRDFVRSYQATPKLHRLGVDDSRGFSSHSSAESKFVELFEIHDRRTGKIMVITMNSDKFLRNERDPLQLNGLPFVSLNYVLRTRNFWVTPDAYYLRQAQAELLDIAVQATAQRRLGVLRFLYSSNAIDDVELDKLLSGEPGVAARVKEGYDLDKVIQPLQPGANYQLYNDAEATRSNAREMVGFSRNQFGEYEGGRKTATEAAVVDRSANLRMSRRQYKIAQLYSRLFEKLNPIIFEYWTTPRVVSIVGEDGVEEWVRFTGSQLRGNYAYSIHLSSDPPVSSSSRKQEALTLYANLIQDPSIDPIALRRYLARAFNDPDFASIFKQGITNVAGSTQVPIMQAQGAQTQNQIRPAGRPVGGVVSGLLG